MEESFFKEAYTKSTQFGRLHVKFVSLVTKSNLLYSGDCMVSKTRSPSEVGGDRGGGG